MSDGKMRALIEAVELDGADNTAASGVVSSDAAATTPISNLTIQSLIHTVRGMPVMLDGDLAALYGVETGALNRAAKRNTDRFPDDFRFRLTREEHDILRCQIGISSDDLQLYGSGGRRYMPYAYTEQGVAMLSAVLRSKAAVEVSVHIMRAFVEMRHFIASNSAMLDQIRSVELRQLEYQKTTDERFERVFDYMEAHEVPKQKIFFDGQVYDAFGLLVSLIQKAGQSIVLIDGYVDASTLNILAKKAVGVDVTVWTHPRTRLTRHDVDIFNNQYPRLTVKHTEAFHDRFLILDGAEGFSIGSSLKDAGKKCFAITRIEDKMAVRDILARLAR